MADMERDETFEKVCALIASSLDVKAEQVQPEASFLDDLGADSLDIVELVMQIERDFNIEIPDEQAEKISTVQDAVDYVRGELSRLGKQA